MGKEYRKVWLSYFAEEKRYAAMTGSMMLRSGFARSEKCLASSLSRACS